MEKEFWIWFEKQGFPFSSEELWEMDETIKYSLMIGPMMQFINEFGKVKQFNFPKYESIKLIWLWLQEGVSWNSPKDSV